MVPPGFERGAAEAGLALGDERFRLQTAAEVSGARIWHDLTAVADTPQVAGDDVGERSPFAARDFGDAALRRTDRDLCDERGRLVSVDRLEQAGGSLATP